MLMMMILSDSILTITYSQDAKAFVLHELQLLSVLIREREIVLLHIGCANTVHLRYFLVVFRKNMARMNGMPISNQE